MSKGLRQRQNRPLQSSIKGGGSIRLALAGGEAATGIQVEATGPNARIPPNCIELLAGRSQTGSIDAHVIQPFYTGLLAKAAGMNVEVTIHAETVPLTMQRIASLLPAAQLKDAMTSCAQALRLVINQRLVP